jgi:hypothetical protein
MKTKRSSQQGDTRPTAAAADAGAMEEFRDPLSAEWRGALEYDRDHGAEVLCAKKECVAQGHCLSGAE